MAHSQYCKFLQEQRSATWQFFLELESNLAIDKMDMDKTMRNRENKHQFGRAGCGNGQVSVTGPFSARIGPRSAFPKIWAGKGEQKDEEKMMGRKRRRIGLRGGAKTRKKTLEGGLEPPTLWLTATRSNQLSYSSG